MTAVVPMSLWIFGRGVRDWDAVRVGALPLAMGGALLTLLAFAVPALAGPLRLAFPLNLTMPVLFVACSFAGAVVLWAAYPPLGLLGDVARYDQIWARLDVAAACAVYQSVVLSILSVLSKPEARE